MNFANFIFSRTLKIRIALGLGRKYKSKIGEKSLFQYRHIVIYI